MLPVYGLITQCLLCGIIIYIVNYVIQHARYYRLTSKIPGPSLLTMPMVRDPISIVWHKMNVLHTLLEYHANYGEIFRMYLPRMTVILTKPEDVEIFCTRSDLMTKPDAYSSIEELLGNTSLLTSKGEIFRKSKKVFMKAFVGMDIRYIIDAFYEGVQDITEKFDQHVGGPWFSAGDYLIEVAFSNILRGALAMEAEELPGTVNFLKSFDRYLQAMVLRGWTPLLKYDLIFQRTPVGREIKFMNDRFSDLINKKIKSRWIEYGDLMEKDGDIPNQFAYTVLRERKDEINRDKSLLDDCRTLVGTASDTSSLTVGYALHMLGMHPEIQEKVYDEDHRIQKELAGRRMTEADIKSYKYLIRVLKESLRINATAPFVGREVLQDLKIGKHTIPKGSSLLILITALHRNPQIYPDPLRFDPDRFLPENEEKRHKYAFCPFSAGPRVCPGARYAMLSSIFMISNIIRRYKVYTKYKSIEELDRNVRGTISLNDIEHFPIRLEAREK